MVSAIGFTLKVAAATLTGNILDILPDVAEIVLKIAKELNNIKEY